MNTPHWTPENPYPVLCAWCLEHGMITLLSFCRVEHSHGICDECRDEEFGKAKEVKNDEREGEKRTEAA